MDKVIKKDMQKIKKTVEREEKDLVKKDKVRDAKCDMKMSMKKK